MGGCACALFVLSLLYCFLYYFNHVLDMCHINVFNDAIDIYCICLYIIEHSVWLYFRTMKREVTSEMNSNGFFRTGIYADVCQVSQ